MRQNRLERGNIEINVDRERLHNLRFCRWYCPGRGKENYSTISTGNLESWTKNQLLVDTIDDKPSSKWANLSGRNAHWTGEKYKHMDYGMRISQENQTYKLHRRTTLG